MKSNSDTWTLWTDRQIHRLTDIKRDRSTDRQTDRQTGIFTVRCTDKQIHRHINRQKELQTSVVCLPIEMECRLFSFSWWRRVSWLESRL